MFARTVSVILIAAVIACPLWCGDGLGLAGQCGSNANCEAATCCSTCELQHCELDAHDSQRHQDHQCPCESTSCQGICGGAVLQKTVEVDYAVDSFLLPLADMHASAISELLIGSQQRDERQHICGSSANHGRLLRTLHMSFLC